MSGSTAPEENLREGGRYDRDLVGGVVVGEAPQHPRGLRLAADRAVVVPHELDERVDGAGRDDQSLVCSSRRPILRARIERLDGMKRPCACGETYTLEL